MREEAKGSNLLRLALGAGVLAAAGMAVVVFVPRRRWAVIGEPFRAAMQTPLAVSLATWATGLWREATAPNPPAFNDLRPFDEF